MFNYLWWDLSTLKEGQIVKVEMATAANVKLLDYDNFTLYKIGGMYKFFGGFASKTTCQIDVPYNGNWILVVDLTEPFTTFAGHMKVNNVSIITPTTHSDPQYEVISSPPEEAMAEELVESYDIFLSHATEDNDSIARPLKIELEKLGLSVWFDESESNDSSTSGLRKSIDSGIFNSKYAVIVLSPDYMHKSWTSREFDGITSMEMTKKQTVLCVWHNVTHDAVLKYSPPLANKFARDTEKYSAQEIALAFSEIITTAKKKTKD